MHLVDRRSFTSGTVGAKDALVLPNLPLVTIRFSAPDTEFAEQLDQAVDAAVDRKADAEFDVVIPLAPKAVPSEAMQNHATDVAHEIAERGISTDRIHIGVAQDQGAPSGELRIFVR
jgi:type IV pilus biogenesis protein CpaD/CtpE